MDIALEQVFGEAHVVQPEQRGSTINQYTTYLVQVKLGSEDFSCRMRYSDFEWLRTVLITHFPGVRVPPLPRKQKIGRFEETFIENRRAGLEDFLSHVLRKRQLCIDSPTLKTFLRTTTEEGMEELKKNWDKRPVTKRLEEYQSAFASTLAAGANLPQDDSRITACRVFLEVQTKSLSELCIGFKTVVDAQKAVTAAVTGAQKRLAAVCSHESEALTNAGITGQPRMELVASLRQQSQVLEVAPALHYDLLLAAAERELLEAEAMQQAIESLDNLQKDLQTARQAGLSMDETLRKVEMGGEIPSTGTGMARMLGIAPKKDRDQRIEQMKAELAQKRKEVTAIEEFYKAARTVLACKEIEGYFNDNVVAHRETKDSFSKLSRTSSEHFVDIWSGRGLSMVESQGYPAGAVGSAAVAMPTNDAMWE